MNIFFGKYGPHIFSCLLLQFTIIIVFNVTFFFICYANKYTHFCLIPFCRQMLHFRSCNRGVAMEGQIGHLSWAQFLYMGQPNSVKNTKENVKTLKSSKIWRKSPKLLLELKKLIMIIDQNGFVYLSNSFSNTFLYQIGPHWPSP